MTSKEQLIQERRSRYRRITDYMFRTVSVHADSLWLDFNYEIRNYSNDKYEPAQRGARLTAAIKNFKTRRMTDFVVNVVIRDHIDDFDMTPLTIRRLCKNLFDGRSGSQQNLVQLFGSKGRTRKASERTHELIDELAIQYKNHAKELMILTEIDIEKVKKRYRQSI